MTDLLGAADRTLPDVVALRRRIHAHPELGLTLPRTQTAVLEALDDLDLDIRTGTELSSVVADLHGGNAGPTVLLRADMDALPMPEDTGLDFASDVEGAMHACGHDAHTAMLAGAARVLAARRADIAGTVRFAFQPGEEGFAGAVSMVNEGVLDRPHVDAAFALHVSPNLPSGSVWSRPGALMASADSFEITITGKGGHASTPFLANDPMPVAAELVQALQVFATRRINTFDPVVITIAKIRAGTTSNVIPESVRMEGTLRAVSDAGRRLALAGIERLVSGIPVAHEMQGEVKINAGYPVTVNNDDAAHFLLRVARDVLGSSQAGLMPTPVMGAEDFSYMLRERPGAMAFLGVCPPGVAPARAHSCHSNRMTIDENAMRAGVAVYSALALRFLAEGGL
ncbi:MAG: M20 family metallopeptidase [Actinomycetota bacterium]|nr:M20 family metallopeptidase [Actinomycetota bacterium]